MVTHGDGFIKKTTKGLTVIAFETTKQSRILKKRMRIAALQKEIKTDLRDLGSLVYNAVVSNQDAILGEDEVAILVENVRNNRAEIEHLRDAITRLSRVRKHFEEGEELFDEGLAPVAEPAETVSKAEKVDEPAEVPLEVGEVAEVVEQTADDVSAEPPPADKVNVEETKPDEPFEVSLDEMTEVPLEVEEEPKKKPASKRYTKKKEAEEGGG